MARKLIIEVVGDTRSIEQALRKTELRAQSFGSNLTRNLTRAGVAAGAGLAAGLAVGLKSSIDAAMDAQKVLSQTQVALKDVGASWARYGKRIQDTTTDLSRLASVNDEDLLQSFTVLLRGTKDVNRALQLNATAADLARGRDMDLVSAATLLVKVNAGQLGSARRLGIQIDKNATSQEALAEITRRYAGAAEAYGDTAAGAFDRFQIAVDELKESIGEGLLPTITEYTNKLTFWLENPENKEKVVRDFTTVVYDLAAAFQFTADAIGKLIAAWNAIPNFIRNPNERFPGVQIQAQSVGELNKILNTPYIPDWVKDVVRKAIAATPGVGRRMDVVESGRITPAAPTFAGTSGGARAGQFMAPGAFSTPILSFLNKYKQANDRIVAAQKSAEAYRTRMETQGGWLDFGLERAQATKGIRDDRLWLRKKESWLKERIRHEGRTLELVRDLWRTRQQIRDLNKKQADRDPLAGLAQMSTKQLTRILAAGTGLGPHGLRVLGGNISGANIQPTQIHTAVYLDGAVVARSVNTHNARTSHRTSRQTSGFRG